MSTWKTCSHAEYVMVDSCNYNSKKSQNMTERRSSQKHWKARKKIIHKQNTIINRFGKSGTLLIAGSPKEKESVSVSFVRLYCFYCWIHSTPQTNKQTNVKKQLQNLSTSVPTSLVMSTVQDSWQWKYNAEPKNITKKFTAAAKWETNELNEEGKTY